jgi:D-threo-aldose 1-dehydrogenase
VRSAWTAGVRYVDTAPFYSVGQAERAVGDALRDQPRGEWVLSTKVGRLLRPSRSPRPGSSNGTCCRSTSSTTIRTTASCARSRTARSAWAWRASTFSMSTTSIGIGVNERGVQIAAMEWGDWEAFLLVGRYTLLEQAPLEDLLPK